MIPKAPFHRALKTFGYSALTLIALAVTGCGTDSQPTPTPTPSPTPAPTPTPTPTPTPSGEPVEQGPPNAQGQTPAFPEQNRAPAVDSNVEFSQTVVANGLENPWGMEFLPDGRVLVTERPGRLRIISQSGQLSDPISGLPENIDTRGQGGLLDVSLAPDFDTSRMVYLSFAETRENNKTGTSVARGQLSEDGTGLSDLEIIFRQEPAWDSTLHYGSRIVWNDDGTIFVTLGERSVNDARVLAQDLDAHLGKVIRINPDGSIPDTNPFVDGSGLPEIWSYGHRNVQGATLNAQTGELWTIEHGPRGGDELNRPQAGNNYGWPVITYGIEYSGQPVGQGITAQEGMEQPVYYWDPVIAPGGMLFYDGDMFSEWRGNLIISSLNPGGIVRLVLNNGLVVGEQRLLNNVGRVRDVAMDAEGAIWLITDAADGKLIKLTLGSSGN